jgi:hypothetical protein
MSAYTESGFGAYLRSEPEGDLLAAYREGSGRALADMPRFVAAWRADPGAPDRDCLSPAQVEDWLREHPRADELDLADCRIYSEIWMTRP